MTGCSVERGGRVRRQITVTDVRGQTHGRSRRWPPPRRNGATHRQDPPVRLGPILPHPLTDFVIRDDANRTPQGDTVAVGGVAQPGFRIPSEFSDLHRVRSRGHPHLAASHRTTFGHRHGTGETIGIDRCQRHLLALREQRLRSLREASFIFALPTLEGRKERAHLLSRPFGNKIPARRLVHLIRIPHAELDHLTHIEVLREPPVLTAIHAIIPVGASVDIRTFVRIRERHTATLTKFPFHILLSNSSRSYILPIDRGMRPSTRGGAKRDPTPRLFRGKNRDSSPQFLFFGDSAAAAHRRRSIGAAFFAKIRYKNKNILEISYL